MRTEKEKMLAGDLYRPSDPEIQADQLRAQSLAHRFNATPPEDADGRRALMTELLGAFGEGSLIRPPFHCDFGFNIRVGSGCFMNYGCVFLDVVGIEVGDLTQIGPGVQVYAADHPRDAATRRSGLEFGRPVKIGSNVWIGGGALIMPGITIGDDAVIGAGSVVTRDVPAGAAVAGNPARMMRR